MIFDKVVKIKPRARARLQEKRSFKMTVRGSVKGRDFSLEATSTSFNMADVTAVNFDAQLVLLADLQTAIQGVSLIDFEGRAMNAIDIPAEQDQPASPYAQREAKWLVKMVDDITGDAGSMEIGGPDLTLLSSDGETADLTDPLVIALVAAIEAGVRSKVGNTVTVSTIVHVGRNN